MNLRAGATTSSTFQTYFEQYVFYAMAGLLAWLCLSSVNNQKDTAVLLTKVSSIEQWVHGIALTQNEQGNRISRVEQALADGKDATRSK